MLVQDNRSAMSIPAPKVYAGLGEVALQRSLDGRLMVLRDGEQTAVRACRCFPWTEPTRFISLRDESDNEVALVTDVNELMPVSRQVLEDAVAEAGFVLEIVAVESVEEEVEIRNWRVQTRHGTRRFQTRLDDWPRKTPGGGLLIRDVAEDLLYVSDPAALDEKSRTLLWAFVD
jgi:hypothetical protein